MSSEDTKAQGVRGSQVTRRDFLKVAGVGAAALGLGGGLSGAVAACGGDSDGGDSGGGTTGRDIKVGFVAPLTGPLAAFGEADKFCVDQWNAAVKDGLTTADGETHKVQILVRDSQSDANRAATVAGDLITNDGVDMMMTASTSDTVNPVADQAEALGVPCFSSDSPWQNYVFARGGSPDKPFKYTYHAFWGVETNAAVQLDIWSKIKTNKKIGLMCPNDADGLALADPKTGLPFFFKQAGYTVIDGGRYQDGSEDFTSEISKFKAAGCELVSGVMIPPDFVNFWKQCHQQGFQPKAVTMPKALLFPSVLESMGEYRLRPHLRAVVVAGLPVQVVADRRYLPAAGRHLDDDHRQAVGAAADALHPLRGRRGHPQAHDEHRRQGRHRAGAQGDRPRHHRRQDQLHAGRRHQPRSQRQRDAAGRRAVDEGQDLPVRDRDRVELGGAAGADRGRRPAPHLLRGDRPPAEPAGGDGPGASARPVALPLGAGTVCNVSER